MKSFYLYSSLLVACQVTAFHERFLTYLLNALVKIDRLVQRLPKDGLTCATGLKVNIDGSTCQRADLVSLLTS